MSDSDSDSDWETDSVPDSETDTESDTDFEDFTDSDSEDDFNEGIRRKPSTSDSSDEDSDTEEGLTAINSARELWVTTPQSQISVTPSTAISASPPDFDFERTGNSLPSWTDFERTGNPLTSWTNFERPGKSLTPLRLAMNFNPLELSTLTYFHNYNPNCLPPGDYFLSETAWKHWISTSNPPEYCLADTTWRHWTQTPPSTIPASFLRDSIWKHVTSTDNSPTDSLHASIWKHWTFIPTFPDYSLYTSIWKRWITETSLTPSINLNETLWDNWTTSPPEIDLTDFIFEDLYQEDLWDSDATFLDDETFWNTILTYDLPPRYCPSSRTARNS